MPPLILTWIAAWHPQLRVKVGCWAIISYGAMVLSVCSLQVRAPNDSRMGMTNATGHDKRLHMKLV